MPRLRLLFSAVFLFTFLFFSFPTSPARAQTCGDVSGERCVDPSLSCEPNEDYTSSEACPESCSDIGCIPPNCCVPDPSAPPPADCKSSAPIGKCQVSCGGDQLPDGSRGCTFAEGSTCCIPAATCSSQGGSCSPLTCADLNTTSIAATGCAAPEVCCVAKSQCRDAGGNCTAISCGAAQDVGEQDCGLGLRCCVPSGAGGGKAICTDNQSVFTAIGCIPWNSKDAITLLLRWAVGLSGGVAFLVLVYAGIQITTAGGDP